MLLNCFLMCLYQFILLSIELKCFHFPTSLPCLLFFGILIDISWYIYFAILRELVIDREAWHAAVHGVTKSWTRLSDWTDSDGYNFNYIPPSLERLKIFFCVYCLFWFPLLWIVYLLFQAELLDLFLVPFTKEKEVTLV